MTVIVGPANCQQCRTFLYWVRRGDFRLWVDAHGLGHDCS